MDVKRYTFDVRIKKSTDWLAGMKYYDAIGDINPDPYGKWVKWEDAAAVYRYALHQKDLEIDRLRNRITVMEGE